MGPGHAAKIMLLKNIVAKASSRFHVGQSLIECINFELVMRLKLLGTHKRIVRILRWLGNEDDVLLL